MKQTTTAIAFLLSIFISLSAFTQNLNQFYQEEQNAIGWNNRFNAAPSGSWEEQQARQYRDQFIQRAIQAAGPYAYSGMDWTQIEQFADLINTKFNAAPSNSAIEGMYRQVRDTAYQAFTQSLQNYVNYYQGDWRQIHQLAINLDTKFNAASSGSQKERAYDQARRVAWQRLPQSVDQELNHIWDFRQIETQAAYFTNLYNSASSGSLKENVYNQVRRSAYQIAIYKFNQQIYQMPPQQRWQTAEEYNNKFNSARSGSIEESYFRQIRDLARSTIN